MVLRESHSLGTASLIMYFLCFRSLPPLSSWPGHCQKFTAVHLSPRWTGLASRQRILVYMLVLLLKHPSRQGDTVGFQCTEPKCESMCLCVCVLVCPVGARCLFSVPASSDCKGYWGNKGSLPTTGHWVFPAQSMLVTSALGTAGKRRTVMSCKRHGKSDFKTSKNLDKVIRCHFCLVYCLKLVTQECIWFESTQAVVVCCFGGFSGVFLLHLRSLYLSKKL